MRHGKPPVRENASPNQPHLTQLRSVLIGVKSLLQALRPVLKSREMRNYAERAARAWRWRARTSMLTVLLLVGRAPILLDAHWSNTPASQFLG